MESETMSMEQARRNLEDNIDSWHPKIEPSVAIDALIAAVRNEILAEFEEVALEFQKDTREYNPTIVNETLLACSNRIWNLIESIKNEKGDQQ